MNCHLNTVTLSTLYLKTFQVFCCVDANAMKPMHMLGWWKGELNGKTGLFPVNYVHTVEQHNNTPAASATTATSAAAATSSADSKSADATQTSTSEVASESAPVTAESTNGDVKETEPLLAETNVSESTQSTEPEEVVGILCTLIIDCLYCV